MAQRQKTRTPRPRSRSPRSASFTRPHASDTLYRQLQALTGPKAIREWLSLSLAEVAEELNRIVFGDAKAGHFNKQKVDRMERAGRVPRRVRQAYGLMIANELHNMTDRVIGIAIKANSPWRITAWLKCSCEEWFVMERSNQKHCPKCLVKK
ncbi:MAG TPA: hypothetical protein VJG32_18065 [Anaerolineae bacterium]|nr:hypothetical protein [Anaerolineae bacterium]